MSRHALIAILGPTAVGKTEWSLVLAERLRGEIVSADSRLLYRGMDIGTAKPSAEARRRVPHHLIDVADPTETWSLAAFRQAALTAIADIHSRGRLPFLVGGTGQYVTAILQGWSPPPRPKDSALRRELEAFALEQGAAALHQRLRDVDPVAADGIDPRNVRRVIRALEIASITGRRPSDQRVKTPPPFRVLKIGFTLPRGELFGRIDARIDAMLEQGWVEEVRRLLAAGVSPDLPSMSAIGYRELAGYIAGKSNLEAAVKEIRRASRVFVRRQANWFKLGDKSIRWFESRPGVEAAAEATIQTWLELPG